MEDAGTDKRKEVMDEAKNNELFKSWAILELMGHRRLAGLVSEEVRFGTTFLRIDIPNGKDFVTQYYGGNSIYCLTPTTEETARMVARNCQPEPVFKYEINIGGQLPYMAGEDDQDYDRS